MTVAGGTKGTFTPVSTTVYTLAVTPAANSVANITVDAAASAAIDANNNPSIVATQSVQAVDTIAPTLASGSFVEDANSTITVTFDENMSVTDLTGVVVQINGAGGTIATGISATTTAININSTTTLTATDYVNISYDGTGNITDVAGNGFASSLYYIGGSGNNTINVGGDTSVRIDGNGGGDSITISGTGHQIVNAGDGSNTIALGGASGGSIITTGVGDDIITGGAGNAIHVGVDVDE